MKKNSEAPILAEDVLGELKKLDPEDQKMIINELVISEHFTGPLPPPQYLHQYEQTLPGAAERIFAIAEKQQEHRQAMEKTGLKSVTRQTTRAQWMAFILTILFSVIATWMVVTGFQTIGIIIFGTTIAAVITAFIAGSRIKKTSPEQ